MKRRTLISLCACYLNTNYISVEQLVDLFGYGPEEDLTVEHFRQVMEPEREKRLERIDNGEDLDDGNLEEHATHLADELEKLTNKLITQ